MRLEHEKTFTGRGGLPLMDDARGVTAIEYTLIAALIAVAAVLVIAEIGIDVSAPFNTIGGNL
jgi:Flp pilus assembly pilin Flp